MSQMTVGSGERVFPGACDVCRQPGAALDIAKQAIKPISKLILASD